MAECVGWGDAQLRQPRGIGVAGILPAAIYGLFLLLPLAVAANAMLQRGTITPNWGQWLAVLVGGAGQALLSTALTVSLAMPLAYLLARFEFRGRRWLSQLALLPFLLPTVVTGLALRQLVGGLISPGLLLLLIGHAWVNLAVVLRLVVPVWKALDARLEWSAAALGATRSQVWRELTWPLLRPAIARSSAIVFAYCFSSLGLLLILGGGQRTLESELLRRITLLLDFGGGAVIAVMQLVCVGFVLWLGNREASLPRGFVVAREFRRPLASRLRWLPVAAAGGLGLPLLALLAQSLPGWEGLLKPGPFGVPAAALLVSLRNAALAGLFAALMAGGVCVAALRPEWRWLRRLSAIPLLVSPVALGLGLLLSYGRPPLLLPRSGLLLPLVHAVAAAPLAVTLLRGLLEQADARLRVVAAALGSTPIRGWWSVYGPLLRRGLPAAAALGATISLGEFGAASFLADPAAPTATVLVMRLLGRPGSLPVAAALALALAASALVLMRGLEEK